MFATTQFPVNARILFVCIYCHQDHRSALGEFQGFAKICKLISNLEVEPIARIPALAIAPFSLLPRNASGNVSRFARSQYVGYAVDCVSRDTLIRLIDYPELPLRIHTRDTIKAGRSALLVRGEFPIGGRMVAVAYKRVTRRTWWKVFSAWFSGNRTLRTWRMALRLQRLGISTPSPLLVVVPRWHQPWRPSYSAMEWLPQSLNLTAYAEWLQDLPLSEARLRLHSAAEQLGELIGTMHARGVSHRDLKAGNLLLINKSSSVEAFVIDLDGACRYVWLPRFRRLRDLSRLVRAMEAEKTLTRSARLRFLQSYLRSFGEVVDSWKSIWRQLARLAQKRQMKNHQRGSCPL